MTTFNGKCYSSLTMITKIAIFFPVCGLYFVGWYVFVTFHDFLPSVLLWNIIRKFTFSCLIFFLSFYFRAVFTYCGVRKEVAYSELEKLVPGETNVFVACEKANWRFCEKCNAPKPERTHHCSKCKQCVLKMDHHCVWIAGCVGSSNQKFFMQFLIITAVITFVFSFYYVFLFFYYLYHKAEILSQFLFGLYTMFCLNFCGLVVVALKTQIHHVANNTTTIEELSIGTDNPYDLGLHENLVQVFGTTVKEWLLPVSAKGKCGYSYQRKNTSTKDA